MKVLQINSVCGIGSTGRIATDIHSMLIVQDYENYIAFGREIPKYSNNTIRIGTKLDNYAHVAKTRLIDKHGFGSKKATIKFIEKVKRLDPDIIHLHNIHGYYINIDILFDYLKESNKPVIWTLHDCWAFTGHCVHFDYVGCKKWIDGCYDCPEKNSYPASLIIDNSKSNYIKKKEIFTGIKNLTVVTPSNWLADLVKQSFLNEYPVKVINNGIDLDVFKPINSDFRENHNANDKFIILGVANVWNRRKGLDYFIELSKRLNFDEIIIIVGLTEKQKSQLPDNIIGINKTKNTKELAEIYTAADVFINPTLEEVMGMTNVEALACGTPVITFQTGGSVECIDFNTGFIVKKGNIEELLSAIKKIKLVGKNVFIKECIKRAKKLYDKKHRFNDYINLYEESTSL